MLLNIISHILSKVTASIKSHIYYVVIFMFIVFINFFSYKLVLQERTIYYWDAGRGWNFSMELHRVFSENPIGVFNAVSQSIKTYTYNYIPIMFILPFILIFGDSRVIYILALVNFYIVPCFVFYLSLFKVKKLNDRTNLIISLITFLLFIPPLISPIFVGYEDIFCVLVILIIYYLFQKYCNNRKSILIITAVGFLLAILAIARRYFILWSASFILGFAILLIVKIVFSKASIKEFKNEIRDFLLLVLSFSLSFILIAKQIAINIITIDYTRLYEPFRTFSSLVKETLFNIGSVFTYYGLLIILLAIIGVIWGLGNNYYKRLVFILLIQLPVIIVLFSTTQDLLNHHQYLFITTLLVYATLGLKEIYNNLFNKYYRALIICFLLIILITSHILRFSAYLDKNIPVYEIIFGSSQYHPKVNIDLPQIYNLTKDIIENTRQPDSFIYILANSDTFNNDIVRQSCYMIYGYRTLACKSIFVTNDLDRRDGFPWQIFFAKTIVVATPLFNTTFSRQQRVVAEPALALLSAEGFGSFFDILPQKYSLHDGTTIYLFKRKENYDKNSFIHSLDSLQEDLK
jgi:hypothetical protein